MNRMSQQQTQERYTRALSTMTFALDALRDEPDPDGTIADLVNRIEVEREWIRFLMALGEQPSRPPDWLRHTPSALVREQRRLLTQAPAPKIAAKAGGSGGG
jgi:hypothetical protein